MKKRAMVLGCGLVGATMARDMAADLEFEVVAVDVNPSNLRKLDGIPNLRTLEGDLSSPASLRSLVADADVVLGAMPSRFGFQTLKTIIECGKPFADISFMAEDALELDALAKQKQVTAVVDCGVSPGLSNLIIGYVHSQLDHTESAEIYVGGLPKTRRWPFDYKAPFAPSDVIEEYTRPSRLVEHGRVVTRPALSEPELLDFPQVGTLEAFNTDGLRSLIRTVRIDNMKEKTLRYPGHRALMEAFRAAGLFSQEPIPVTPSPSKGEGRGEGPSGGTTSNTEVRTVQVRPLDVTAKLLFPLWTYEPGEEEFTVLRVIISGQSGGRPVRHVYDLYDEYDRATTTSSMARTTAFPCTIVARMLARGEVMGPGVLPPELLAKQRGAFDAIVQALTSRNVRLTGQVQGSRNAG